MTDTSEAREPLADRLVLKGALFRRQGRPVELRNTPPLTPETRTPVRRPAKVARMLALAHHLQRLIDQGLVADRAAVARNLGQTRARITQVLDLLLLAPELQVAVLELESVDAHEPTTERLLRSVAHGRTWEMQRRLWANLVRVDRTCEHDEKSRR